jgi:bifunctional DNA-binding transcriptional regulator/antitoxin component of YhaV-PrlF toxin-antitoxin module
MRKTVKARRKYGANSLDLTIPADLCRELDLNVGDVFEVSHEERDGRIQLHYLKVYKYRNKRGA